MDTQQQRLAMLAQLEGALDLAERLKEPTLTYLIERALDEARSRSISGIKGDELLIRH
jgi:hypothetical protein